MFHNIDNLYPDTAVEEQEQAKILFQESMQAFLKYFSEHAADHFKNTQNSAPQQGSKIYPTFFNYNVEMKLFTKRVSEHPMTRHYARQIKYSYLACYNKDIPADQKLSIKVLTKLENRKQAHYFLVSAEDMKIWIENLIRRNRPGRGRMRVEFSKLESVLAHTNQILAADKSEQDRVRASQNSISFFAPPAPQQQAQSRLDLRNYNRLSNK